MFKHLTRTLKLGLTTLTILTAGAGAAFATHDHSAEPVDIVNDCSGDDIFNAPSYCTNAVINCIVNPFGTSSRTYGTGGCATTLGTKAHTVAKVRYCRDQDVPSVASDASAHACHDTWGGANAANWAKQNPDAADSVATVTSGQKRFVKGTASGLDVTGVRIYTSASSNSTRGRLNFNTAEFNDQALGGDATDGVAFFLAGNGSFYAGIFSGTDLGAPVTQRSGTASWVGQFQTIFFDTKKDFVLEVTFGGTGDVAGSIEAFIHRKSSDTYYNIYAHHFHLKGEFDDSGLITGTVDAGKFTNKDREATVSKISAPLTGLIGQEGAVGVFYTGGTYAGGFVARPPTTEPKEGETYTETKFLNDTCSADPFTNKHQEFCNLEYADDRVTRINDCITGGNASGAECRTAREAHECISNPFATDCADEFTDYYETAQANRIQFCLGDINNALCTNSDTVAGICAYAPFASVCFDGDTYKSTRKDKINDCRTNTSDPSCTGVTDNPNAVAWEDSFATALPSVPDTGTNRRNQFLTATGSGVNKGDLVLHSSGSLNMSTAIFNGRALGGNAADGAAYIFGRVNGQGTSYSYAGIFSGTDLGAPVTNLSGTASWVGRFQGVWGFNTDFVLEIDFDGGDQDGTIEAFVKINDNYSTYHTYLKGSFDVHGVIAGTFDYGAFANQDRHNPTDRRYSGVLTGLIGKEGAVGAFHSDDDDLYYVGGFVARPPTTEPKEGETYTETKFLNDTCTADPFGYLCYLETDKQRAKIIECTEGSNAGTPGCERAVELNTCLTNPFASNCVTDFADYYVAAREKRNEFCVGDLTNSLCTVPGAKEAICTYAPFASICFDDNEYKDARETKYTSCHADPSIPSCTGVTDRPNGIAWADSFATALADTPAPPTDGTTRGNQFLKGTASGVNKGDIVIYYSGDEGSLNLNTAEFNGEDLGGDAADGVAFFVGRVNGLGTWYYYTGIFSGTDLGAPVTQTSGTVSWVGRFQTANFATNKEFVLEIDFNGTGDKAGYIKAFVQEEYSGTYHFYLDGSYDAHGLITGTVDLRKFTNNDRDDTTGSRRPGILTGLIGEDGAVGAFISNTNNRGQYAGGFVARPPTDAEMNYVTTTCEDDPFHEFCHVNYSGQRLERIGDCTASDDAATDTEYCGRAITRNPCILNPFADNCAQDLEHHYAAARVNRISFCNNPDNADVSVCSGDAIANICTYNPFIAVCFGDNTYNSARLAKVDFCRNNANKHDPTCTGAFSRPNIASFLLDFDTEPPLVPDTSSPVINQFLKGSATDLDDGTLRGLDANTLRLSDSLHAGAALGGDTVDGVAFFGVASGGRYSYYAGLLSGTDLGLPLVPTDVPTEWNGKFQAVGSYPVAKDFTLKITFTTGEYAGRIEGLVQRSGSRHYHIQGNFSDNGVIANGTVNYGKFEDGKPIPSRSDRTGQLRGLIGQEGAVGAFIADMNGPSGFYAGGFVARPPQ